jgi:hypothetical protein
VRPFADKADMRNRVNGAVGAPHDFVGHKLVAQFHFTAGSSNQQPQRTRNAEHARELFALHVTVPWSAWNGYEQNSGVQRSDWHRLGLQLGREAIHDPFPAACRVR